MRRPTRTRRLSIAAIISLLAFVAVAGAAVTSLRAADAWNDGNGQGARLFVGRVTYELTLDPPFSPSGRVLLNFSAISPSLRNIGEAIWGFRAWHGFVTNIYVGKEEVYSFSAPLWPILLLLLIAPVRWLIARAQDAPAFPVVTATTGKAKDV